MTMVTKRVLFLCLVGIVGLASGYFLGRQSAPDALESYIARRAWVLEEEANRSPDRLALLICDSLTDQAGVHTLCGAPVFNTGVSAATAKQMPNTSLLVDRLRPSMSFVAVGTNDVRLETPLGV